MSGPASDTFGETATWSVPQLVAWVNAVVADTLGGEIWVEGEIANLQRSNAGHVYFTLRTPADEAAPGKPADTLAVTLFDWHRQTVNWHLKRSGGAVRMADGVRVRIRGGVEVYGPRSQLQMKMTGIDPIFTLGSMAADRERLVASLAAEGLLDANKSRPVPVLPLRLALVTSLGSAAHADALDELTRCGLAWDVLVIDTRVQGADAAAAIVAALARATAAEVDLALVVRGGGARTDLAAFDLEVVARAIAASPVPVWTGLGHEIDRTVADEVAHTAWKTPTACAAAVVEHATCGVDRLATLWDSVTGAASERFERAVVRVDRLAGRTARRAVGDLDEAAASVAALRARVRRGADLLLVRHEGRVEAARRSVAAEAPRRCVEADRRLDALAATARAYDPAATLARGWSITRGPDGRVARVADLRPGDALRTTLADGTVDSAVTSTVSP